MEVRPRELHERTPLVLGSKDEVTAVLAHFRSPADAMP
jgi:fructose-1,6-bisphosphatase